MRLSDLNKVFLFLIIFLNISILKAEEEVDIWKKGSEKNNQNVTTQERKIDSPLINKNTSIIGKNTISAMESGIFWGYVSMIEGLIKKINVENKERYKIILTGGNANYFKNMFNNVYEIDDLFTSRGLNFLIDGYNK